MNHQLACAIPNGPTAPAPVDAGTAVKPSAGKRPEGATVEQRQLAFAILSGDPGASHRGRITPPGSGPEDRATSRPGPGTNRLIATTDHAPEAPRGDLEAHQVASVFPVMNESDYQALRDDIAAHGLREPIWLHEGKILDGRNRYRACFELQITPAIRQWAGEGGSPMAFVASLNLHRRHLDESQRALAGVKIKALFEEEAKARQEATRFGSQEPVGANLHRPGDPTSEAGSKDGPRGGRSNEKAAAVVGVSPRSVATASRVVRDGTPELVEQVEAGQVSVSAAAEVAKLPEAEQKEVVARGPRAVKVKAKEARENRNWPEPEAAEATAEEVVGPPLELCDTEQPDDVWLASLPLMDQVRDPVLFKAEALLYRRTTKARLAYIKATKAFLPAKGLAGRGKLQYSLAGPIRAKHPRDWKRCVTCLGRGGDCKGCRGGYVTT